MGLLYQKRRLKVNKIKRRISANRAYLIRIRVMLSLLIIVCLVYIGVKVINLPQWYIDKEKLIAADPSVLKIQGNLITPEYKIVNIIRQTPMPDLQIFRIDTTELEKNIAKLQPVKQVFIRRYWFPARLIVTVDERTPAFLLAPTFESEPNSVLSTDGVLIDHDYLPFSPDIKAKKLLTYGVRNGVEETWDKKRVENMSNLVKALEAYSSLQVKYMDARNQDDVYIMLDDYLIRFGKIDETTFARAKKIAPILPEAKKNKNKLKYIDLRWEDSCYLRLEGVKEIIPEEEKISTKEIKEVKDSKNKKSKQKLTNEDKQNIQEDVKKNIEEEPEQATTDSKQEP